MTNPDKAKDMNTPAGFRRIECVCGKRIRVADQIDVVSFRCPRCGKTLLASSAKKASGFPRAILIALLGAAIALGGGALFVVRGCVHQQRKTAAEEKASAILVEANDWLKKGIKADAGKGTLIEQKLTEAVRDVFLADTQKLHQTLENIRQQFSAISTYTQTRQLLLNAKGILGKEDLDPATLIEVRKLLDAYLQADADNRDAGDGQEAHRLLAEIDATTDSSRIRALLDALDDAAFRNAAEAPPKDGLQTVRPSLRSYHDKWVFPKVYGDASAERDKHRRDEEQARSVEAEEERRRKFAVRADFTGEILGEDPFVYRLGEWTYMLTGGKRISVLRSTDLVVWEDRGELLKGSKLAAEFPGSLSKPECFAEDGALAVRCEATRAGRPTEQYVFTAYVKSLDPQENAPDENVRRVEEGGRGQSDRAVTLGGKKWQFGVKATKLYGATGNRFKNRTESGQSVTCVHVTCDGKPRSNLYKSREDKGAQDLGTLVLAEYLKYTDLGGVHAFVDSKGQLFLAHHFSDIERGGRKTICIRPIVFAADGWPLAGEPLSVSRKSPNGGAALQTGPWTHICTYNIVNDNIDKWILAGTGVQSTQQFKMDGTIDGRQSGITWKQNGDFLTLEWPKPAGDKRMPDANYVDECVLGGEGTWYVGRNQFGELIRGIYGHRWILR